MVGFMGAYFIASRRRPTEAGAHRLVDWERVRAIAAAIARNDPQAEGYADLVPTYAAMVGRGQAIIADYTGEPPPLGTGNIHVFDRIAWLDANVANFKLLFEPLEAISDRFFGGVGTRPFSDMNALFLSSQMCLLMGYLSRRVLG